MHQGTIEMSVVLTKDGKEKVLREYHHNGQVFVEGRRGSDFSIRLTNRQSTKVLAVLSVDGLSVMDGKPCGLDSSGYVLGPWQSVTIPGWRLDNSNIAKFVFSEKPEGYAALSESGDAKNSGVIGLLVFNEKANPVYQNPRPWFTMNNSATKGMRGMTHTFGSNTKGGGEMFSSHVSDNDAQAMGMEPMGMASADTFSLGTGFGDHDEHRVREVSFERADPKTPNATLALYYGDRQDLERRGIQVVAEYGSQLPNPFPGIEQTGCKPPANWKG